MCSNIFKKKKICLKKYDVGQCGFKLNLGSINTLIILENFKTHSAFANHIIYVKYNSTKSNIKIKFLV